MLSCLSACLGGYSPQNRFYNLQPAENIGEQVFEKNNFSLGVGDVELPDYLDKPQIIIMEADSPEIKQAEYDRWGDNLASMIQRVLAADLSNYFPSATVKSKVDLTEKFNYLINVEIVKLDFIWKQKAVLEAWWYINDQNAKTIKRQKFYAEEEIGNSFADFVRAESKMLDQMSQSIAVALVNLKK